MVDIAVVLIVFIVVWLCSRAGDVSGTDACLKEIEFKEHRESCYSPSELREIWDKFNKNLERLDK